LRAAGLPDEAVVALRRIELRLPMVEDADVLARAWATVIAASLAAALQTRELRPLGGSPGDRIDAATAQEEDAGSVVFADPWSAEAEILRLLAAHRHLPWWADAVAPGTSVMSRPAGTVAVAILTTWIERNPPRFAVAMLDLLTQAPSIADLLSPTEVRRLAGRLLHQLGAAIDASLVAQPFRSLPARGEAEDIQTAISGALSELPANLLTALAAIPPERRSLFVLAGLLRHTPAVAVRLVDGRSLTDGSKAALDALSAVLLHTTSTSAPAIISATDAPDISAPALAAAAVGVPVMNAGLLLLLRPLAGLGIVGSLSGSSLSGLLQAFGLAALHRVSQPLLPAARRTLLERDRSLLAVFSGASPPDTPLDMLPVVPEALAHLDALLATAPAETDWVPGALRKYYGGSDPFGDTSEGRLARILVRPARLSMTRWSADITWPVAAADIALRRAGWDIDPGWLPWIGRVVRFHYDGTDEP
jgi:hypothetical protein